MDAAAFALSLSISLRFYQSRVLLVWRKTSYNEHSITLEWLESEDTSLVMAQTEPWAVMQMPDTPMSNTQHHNKRTLPSPCVTWPIKHAVG